MYETLADWRDHRKGEKSRKFFSCGWHPPPGPESIKMGRVVLVQVQDDAMRSCVQPRGKNTQQRRLIVRVSVVSRRSYRTTNHKFSTTFYCRNSDEIFCNFFSILLVLFVSRCYTFSDSLTKWMSRVFFFEWFKLGQWLVEHLPLICSLMIEFTGNLKIW